MKVGLSDSISSILKYWHRLCGQYILKITWMEGQCYILYAYFFRRIFLGSELSSSNLNEEMILKNVMHLSHIDDI